MRIGARWTFRAAALCALAAALGACHSSSNDGGSTPPPAVPNPPVALSGGLNQRPANLTCTAPAKSSTTAGAAIALQRVFAGLPADQRFDQPLAMLQAPGDVSRWYVVEKTGRVRVFMSAPTVSVFEQPFITLTVNSNFEGGLLGMAFHPDYATNRQVFLSWTEGSPMVSVIARFTSLNGGLTLDPGSRQDIIQINQPFDNHNGGHIAFGPDGYLYAGFGDGGSGGDPAGHAQDTTDLLGDMLRLDVDGGTPYAIPSGAAGNPFSGNAFCPADHSATQNCPEIYAWGLRNPWRWNFDSATGELWAGDVGESSLEEVDRVQRGGNYGWDCREGASTFNAPAASCSTATSLINPVHQYGRSLGSSITGGYVYRGAALPALVGRYLFADYGSGRIWRLDDNGSGGFTAQQLLDTSLSIAAFGQGNDGELYVIDIVGGTLHKIVDGGTGVAAGPPVPTLLSNTGCVNAQNPAQAAPGLIPYDVAAPFWSDGATKERWLAVPDGTTIAVGADGDFAFPNGSVLMKHFRLDGALIETRLFMRHPDGDWAGYSYEWNTQQTNATLVQGGKTVALGAQSWIYPSGNDCSTCHTAAAGFTLGLETAQLNHDFTYSTTGRTANQLLTLDQVSMFAAPLGDPSTKPQLADPSAATAALADRARAYLHTNCANCHRAGGPTPSPLDLQYATMLSNTATCDASPQAGDLGLANARIIAPGAPDRSVLLARMHRRDAQAMPPLASNVIDAAGVTLIRDWIAALTTCQ